MSAMLRIAGVATALAGAVSAHGTVSGFDVDGKYIRGYAVSDQYSNAAPVTPGWSIPQDTDNGFVPPSSYGSGDIICHKSATNAQASIDVNGGSKLKFYWTTWPDSHKGPSTSRAPRPSRLC